MTVDNGSPAADDREPVFTTPDDARNEEDEIETTPRATGAQRSSKLRIAAYILLLLGTVAGGIYLAVTDQAGSAATPVVKAPPSAKSEDKPVDGTLSVTPTAPAAETDPAHLLAHDLEWIKTTLVPNYNKMVDKVAEQEAKIASLRLVTRSLAAAMSVLLIVTIVMIAKRKRSS
jgi:hypothetical protein